MMKDRIDQWSDLLKLFDRYDPKLGGPQYIFRGVSDHTYELLPGAGRPVLRDGSNIRKKIKRPYTEPEEIALFEEFKRAARPFINFNITNDAEWMAVAQHHGLMTRFLDWTESPMYAVYFAVEAGGKVEGVSKDAAVYAVPVPNNLVECSPFAFEGVRVYRPPHLSPRITAQRGLFTVHSDPTVAWKPANLIRYRIPWGKCLMFKRRLMLAGISRASLYPDIDGLAQTLNWRHKWNWR